MVPASIRFAICRPDIFDVKAGVILNDSGIGSIKEVSVFSLTCRCQSGFSILVRFSMGRFYVAAEVR